MKGLGCSDESNWAGSKLSEVSELSDGLTGRRPRHVAVGGLASKVRNVASRVRGHGPANPRMVRFVASVVCRSLSANPRHCRGRCVGHVPGAQVVASIRWSEARLECCVRPPVV